MILLLAATAWADVVPPDLRGAEPRPVLSGTEITIDSTDGFFRVHYTLDGADQVDGGAEAATAALDTLVAARDHYAAEGWRALVPDEGAGGSTALDVYIHQVDINGYAHGDPLPGETDRGACWIEIDNTLGRTGNAFTSVVAHELHHCVQYRYTWAADGWIYEAEATYEQYLWDSSGALAFAIAYLWSERLAHPEYPIDTWDGRFAYAGMTFVKFWEDFEADGIRGPLLWEALEADPRWVSAFDTAAQAAWGLSWDEAFLEYSTWMAFACANNDGRWVENGTNCIAQMSVPIEAVTPGTAFPVVHDEARYTATYAAIDEAGSVEVSCDAPGAGQSLGVRVVALDDGDPTAESDAWAENGQPLTVAIDTADSALLVFASTGTRGIETNCTATVTPIEEPPPEGCSCATGAATPPWALVMALAYLTRRSERGLRTRSPVVGGVIARYRGRGSNG